MEPGRNQVEPGRNHCKTYCSEQWSQVGTGLNQARNQVEIEGCLLRNHHFLFSQERWHQVRTRLNQARNQVKLKEACYGTTTSFEHPVSLL